MPTIIAHAIVGATVTTLRPRGVSPVKLAVAAAALAVLPDIDVLGFRYGIAYADALGHRGFTHSLLFAALAAVAVATILFRDLEPRSPEFRRVTGILFVATASHGVLDAFTNAGLGVGFLIPFDDTRYFWPWRPLVASPLSVSRFIDGSGAGILINELKWIGLPALAFAIAALGLRRWRRSRLR